MNVLVNSLYGLTKAEANMVAKGMKSAFTASCAASAQLRLKSGTELSRLEAVRGRKNLSLGFASLNPGYEYSD